MLGNILGWCVFGLLAGALARLFVPGRDTLGCLGTVALGVIGSFVGGLFAHLLFGGPLDRIQPVGFIGAVLGAMIVLLLLRQIQRGT